MSRPGVFALAILCLFSLSPHLPGQKPRDSVALELAVQSALQQGRHLLSAGQPARAVEVLEAKLPYINGNADYLALLRDAYAALSRDYQIKKQDEQAARVREKLQVLDSAPKAGRPPDLDPPPSKARGKVDPFQQTPLMEGASALDLLRRAEVAFNQGRYAEAGPLFAEAHAADPAVIGPRAADWAYCRIFAVVERLKTDRGADAAALAAMDRELSEALVLGAGKPDLVKFGRTVQARLRERQGVPAGDAADVPGWTTAASANFRLMHHLSPGQAEKLLELLEKIRAAAVEKWFGAPASPWSPRCDIFLHRTAADYGTATGKDARGQGHATLDVVDRRVTRRRIDVAGDDPDFATAILPREVTHVVLTDLFPDPMLPRWADEAMAILAQPRDHVQRYLRALPKVARDRQVLPLSQLMGLKEFPEPAAITAFYVQSVSLVDMLVAERGPQHFALFLQQGQRYGFEKALKESYNIKSFTALQEKWQKKAFATTD